ncbi:hypothetical protein MMC08_004151 [Hypocenomyce scalaris]|nr:hypothetical protein [Hypocenomyce scalaris]
MAEVGLIASVIGIAGTGAKLSVTLYTLAETVNSADKSIKDVARDVSITSSVLGQLAAILEQDKQAKISKDDALKTTDDAVRGCSEVFSEIDAMLKKSVSNTNAGKTKAVLEKLKWAFIQPKMELLRSNLERLKSSLLLLLSVLAYARDIATNGLGPHDKSNRRSQIAELNQSNADNQRRHEELLKAIESISIDPSEVLEAGEERGIARKPVAIDSSGAMPFQPAYPTFPALGVMAFSPGTNQHFSPDPSSTSITSPSTRLVSDLALCAARVTRLLQEIECTQNAIYITGPSAVEKLKHYYKDTRNFLNQRLWGEVHPQQAQGLQGDDSGPLKHQSPQLLDQIIPRKQQVSSHHTALGTDPDERNRTSWPWPQTQDEHAFEGSVDISASIQQQPQQQQQQQQQQPEPQNLQDQAKAQNQQQTKQQKTQQQQTVQRQTQQYSMHLLQMQQSQMQQPQMQQQQMQAQQMQAQQVQAQQIQAEQIQQQQIQQQQMVQRQMQQDSMQQLQMQQRQMQLQQMQARQMQNGQIQQQQIEKVDEEKQRNDQEQQRKRQKPAGRQPDPMLTHGSSVVPHPVAPPSYEMAMKAGISSTSLAEYSEGKSQSPLRYSAVAGRKQRPGKRKRSTESIPRGETAVPSAGGVELESLRDQAPDVAGRSIVDDLLQRWTTVADG